MSEALARILAALKACPHQRGINGQPIMVDLADDGEDAKLVQAIRQPCIQLAADDIVAVCDTIPEAQRSPVVKALRLGSSRNTVAARMKLQPVDAETGEELTADQLAPMPVHIHVDHAWHLAEEAQAKGQPKAPGP